MTAFVDPVYGIVDVISIYAPSSVMKRYEVIVALGWSLMNDAIANNIRDYIQGGGIFVSFLTFTHANKNMDELEILKLGLRASPLYLAATL